MAPSIEELTSSVRSADLLFYRCPTCKGALAEEYDGLNCRICARTYNVRGGIPDFILGDFGRSASPVLRSVKRIDWLARIYETKLWYPLVLNLAAGWGRISLPRLVTLIQDIVESTTGFVLDVACGPATYGRRIASPSRKVYGIDVSMGMLERGAAYARREHVTNICLARAQVEALPFAAAAFDAAICCGSLHLFEDTVLALREIDRSLKPGAPLAVITFAPGDSGILSSPPVLKRARKKGLRVFEIAELQRLLGEAGFENYRPTRYGSLLACSAQKCQL